jgi:hypothetical protein
LKLVLHSWPLGIDNDYTVLHFGYEGQFIKTPSLGTGCAFDALNTYKLYTFSPIGSTSALLPLIYTIN